jgi:hypothetical protein
VPVRVTTTSLRSLAVVPTTSRVASGSTVELRANGTFFDGTVQDVTTMVHWESSNQDIAQIAPGGPEAGRARAAAPGAVLITARLGGTAGNAVLTVTGATVGSIAITPSPAKLARGTTGALRAVASFSDGTTQDVTTSAFWTTVDPGIAEVAVGGGESGVVTALLPGTTMVRSAWQGASGMAPLEVTSATLSGIDVTPDGSFVSSGLTLQYQATGRFSDGTTQPLREATWSVSGNAARISNRPATRGLVTGVEPGDVIVSAAFSGKMGSAMLSVIEPAFQRVVVTPERVSIMRDTSVALRAFAEYSDGTSQDVTEQASWTGTPGVVLVSDTPVTRGRTLGLAPGAATVTARFDSKPGSSSVTVTTATISSIAITPTPVQVGPAATTQLRAIAQLSDMTTQDVTISAVWSSSNLSLATVGNTPPTEGLLRGVAPGSATVRAVLKGVEGTATVQVP